MRSRSSKLPMLVLMAGLSGACAMPMARAASSTSDCNRTCLRAVLDQYLAAVFRHDPSRAPLAPGARSTQNAVALQPGEGLWKSATGTGAIARRFADPVSGQAAFLGIVNEQGGPDVVSLRLKVEHRKVTEAEWTVARKADGGMFSIEGLQALPPPTDQPLPSAQRTSRAQMIAAADAYFAGLEKHDGADVPHVAGCERIENGFRVTNRPRFGPPGAASPPPAPSPPSGGAVPGQAQEELTGDCVAGFEMFAHSIAKTSFRRYPVVDEAAGVVLGMTLFHRPPESTMKRNLLSEYFFVRAGRIAGIYAAMYYIDAAAPDSTGWPVLSEGALLPLQTVATTDTNGLEGLDVAADGTLYVTNATSHVLHRVTPEGVVSDFAHLPTVPQVVLRTASGFVLTSQVGEPDFAARMRPGAAPGPLSADAMAGLGATVLVLDTHGRVQRRITGPARAFFNGIDRFGSRYLIADSSVGTIWLLDLANGHIEPWLKDDALRPAAGHFPGANGIKVVHGTVYVANTSGGALYRIDSDAQGKPKGALALIAKIPSPDDFAVAEDGTVYAPSAGKVLKISPSGEVSTLAEGCTGCDAALLAAHGTALYLVTHGFGPAAGRGTIYRMTLASAPPG